MARDRITLKRGVLASLIATLGLAAVLVTRTLSLSSRQLTLDPAPAVQLDDEAAVGRLAGALRIPSVSPSGEDPEESFLELHRYLEAAFPRVHAELTRSVVGRSSLLYQWAGQEPSLEPILLVGHLDVVPVGAETEPRWSHPPFGGHVADGYVWGRGALDMKFAVTAQLEAIEWLLAQGFRPARTVMLAYGDDEEVGGHGGAERLVATLRDRGVRFHWALDEGAAVVHRIVPGVQAPVALVGIAEKGYASVRLTATVAGGHSAMPPPHTAAGLVSTSVHRLERSPLPPSIDGPVSAQFDFLAPEMSFGPRLAVANRWLLQGVLVDRLASNSRTNALVRSTAAATMLQGSVAENVLPAAASAVVNYRIRPGDTVEAVLAHVRAVVVDRRVAVELLPGSHEPSPVSAVDGPGFVCIQRTLAEVLPEAVVAPSLVVGMTDSRHYAALTENTYRFLPMRLGPDDLERIHGIDERLAVDNYAEVVRFYVRLLQNGLGAP